MKTAEELKTLKEEVETLNAKLAELSEEELVQVCGGKAKAAVLLGAETPFTIDDTSKQYENNIYPIETEEAARKRFLGE